MSNEEHVVVTEASIYDKLCHNKNAERSIEALSLYYEKPCMVFNVRTSQMKVVHIRYHIHKKLECSTRKFDIDENLHNRISKVTVA